jgi:hypothetical protein
VDLPLLERALSRLHALATASLRDSPDPTTGLLPPGLQDTPQEEVGDLMYPPQQQLITTTPSSSSTAALTAAAALQQQAVGLMSPPFDADDGDLW